MNRSITIALLALVATPVAADVNRRHGSLCGAKYTSRDLVGVDERGMYNGSSSATATVTCAATDRKQERYETHAPGANPYISSVTPKLTNVVMYGRDLSTTVPFSCYVFATAEDGFTSWGPTKYACSQTGGCPDSTTEFTGLAVLAWDPTNLGDVDAQIGIACNLPPTTASGSSYVKEIKTNDNQYNYEEIDSQFHTVVFFRSTY